MYTPGKLIYFDPFHFKDGSKPKPTSINHLPQTQDLKHGCLEIPDACINCYIFEQGKPITKSGWSFSFHTMLYGNWLDDFEVRILKENYPIQGVDYEIIGELTEEELNGVILCFANSSTVKRKYRRVLSQ